jgi:hypothetical protein
MKITLELVRQVLKEALGFDSVLIFPMRRKCSCTQQLHSLSFCPACESRRDASSTSL